MMMETEVDTDTDTIEEGEDNTNIYEEVLMQRENNWLRSKRPEKMSWLTLSTYHHISSVMALHVIGSISRP